MNDLLAYTAKRTCGSRTRETKSSMKLATPGTWEFSAVALLLFRNPALILRKLLISALRGEKPLDYVQYAPNNVEHSRKPQFVHWRNAILTLQAYISLSLQLGQWVSNPRLVAHKADKSSQTNTPTIIVHSS